jgi:hypothetical protein
LLPITHVALNLKQYNFAVGSAEAPAQSFFLEEDHKVKLNAQPLAFLFIAELGEKIEYKTPQAT